MSKTVSFKTIQFSIHEQFHVKEIQFSISTQFKCQNSSISSNFVLRKYSGLIYVTP